MFIKIVSIYSVSLVLILLSANTLALDLRLPDRLDTPSKQFENIEKTAFLALKRHQNRIITVGERGVIGFSDDAATTWRQSDVPVSTLLTAIDVVSANEAWAVGHSGVILYSDDNAETWQLRLEGKQINQLLLDKAKASLQDIKADYEMAEGDEKEDLEYALEDAEFALSNAEFDLGLGPSNPLLDVQFLDNRRGFAVGAYGLFVSTIDGGTTWQSAAERLENFDRYHLNTLAYLGADTIIIAGEAGTLFASYDGGAEWETLYGPYQGSFFGIQATGIPGEALLYGLKGHIFKTTDGGQGWKRIVVDVETSLTASALSERGDIAIVGLSGVVLVSKDKGESFVLIPTEGFEGFNAVEFIDEDTLVLVSDEGIRRLRID